MLPLPPSQIVGTIISGERVRSAWARWVVSSRRCQGAEARADQRTGRDLVHLTDVPGRLPTPSFLVVADGFYEWRKNDRRRGTPFFIRLRSGRPFGFAGVWSMKHDGKGTHLATCAITTCLPNELMATIHDRMPVILPPDARDRWLERG
jgi:SOS response associated peptidase (SRAP)